MPIPLSETERHFAHQVGETVQEQTSEGQKKEGITPETTPQPRKSISERINKFLDNIVTPKGT